MARHRVDVAGVEIAVADQGVGQPCLVLHGFTGSGAAMRPLIDGLALDGPAGARTIAPDLVGHGDSDAPDDVAHYRMDAMVDHLDAVLDHARVDAAVVVGYSFGARLGLTYAVARPDRVRELVTIGGTPGLRDPAAAADRRAADEALAADIEAHGVPAFVDRWEQGPIFATQHRLPDAVRASIRSGRLANRAHGLANSLRGAGTGAMPSLWGALAELHVPTTVIAGGLDTKFVSIGREMVSLLPQATLDVVPDVGHAVHLEATNACTAIVERSLVRP